MSDEPSLSNTSDDETALRAVTMHRPRWGDHAALHRVGQQKAARPTASGPKPHGPGLKDLHEK